MRIEHRAQAVGELIAAAVVAAPCQSVAEARRQQRGKAIVIDAPAADAEPRLPLLRTPLPLRLRAMQRVAQIGRSAARRILQNRHQQCRAGGRVSLLPGGAEHGAEARIAAELCHAASRRAQLAAFV